MELPKKLQNKIKQIKGCKRAILFKSYQPNTPYTSQLGGRERSYLTKTKSPYLLFQGHGKGKKRI